MQKLKLHAITDGSLDVEKLAAIIIKMKDTVDYVHVREKSKKAIELLSLLSLLREGNVPKEKIIINDRLDVACLFNIPNVHLPSHGLPTKRVREDFPQLKIGRSIHSLGEAKEAEADGADYVLYGHVFDTDSKKGKPARGINELIEIKKELQIPVYAIGGITPEKIRNIRQTNADGIAIMSGIFSADNPVAAAKRLFDICKEESNENNF